MTEHEDHHMVAKQALFLIKDSLGECPSQDVIEAFTALYESIDAHEIKEKAAVQDPETVRLANEIRKLKADGEIEKIMKQKMGPKRRIG